MKIRDIFVFSEDGEKAVRSSQINSISILRLNDNVFFVTLKDVADDTLMTYSCRSTIDKAKNDIKQLVEYLHETD